MGRNINAHRVGFCFAHVLAWSDFTGMTALTEVTGWNWPSGSYILSKRGKVK